MRVYVAATVPLLARWLAVGQIGPAPLTAFAVTPALREWYVEGDAEELEYAAMSVAARASLRLLAADASAPRRRVVVAADVADGAARPAPDADRAAVRVGASLPWAAVASAHLDDPAAASVVAAAAAVVAAADAGDEDAEFAVGEAEDQDLQWYGAQEIPPLLGGP